MYSKGGEVLKLLSLGVISSPVNLLLLNLKDKKTGYNILNPVFHFFIKLVLWRKVICTY